MVLTLAVISKINLWLVRRSRPRGIPEHVSRMKDCFEILFAGLSALAAIDAFRYAVIQVSASKRITRESNALQAHHDYPSLCLQHPELPSSLIFAKSQGVRSFDNIDTTLSKETEAYLWFLSILKNSCEHVVENVAAKGPWRRILCDLLRIHWPALKMTWPTWEKGHGENVRRLVAEVLVAGPEAGWTKYTKT